MVWCDVLVWCVVIVVSVCCNICFVSYLMMSVGRSIVRRILSV